MGGDKAGLRADANAGDVESQPVFQSRLRAKREERMLQRQLEQASNGFEIHMKAARGWPESSSAGKDNSHRPTAAEAGDDAVKRRERAEARKRVIEYHGTVWDAVKSNEFEMVQNYFLVEGAPTLLRRRHPDTEQGGRSLLHYAAWHGRRDIVELILSTGCNVDVIDSVASRTTALIEAARAGHSDICVSLLRHGASPRHIDSHGDTAFHWAGRQAHGTVLLQMALEQESFEPGSTPALWVIKNFKGRTVIDLVQNNAVIVPLLQARLGSSFTRAVNSAKGKRKSRFPVRAAVYGTRKSTLIRANSRSGQASSDLAPPAQVVEPLEPTLTNLSGVEELGLDVSSFTYRSREIRVDLDFICLKFVKAPHCPISRQLGSMEGFILTASTDDKHRHQLQKKKKQEWRNFFLKLDDISARLIAFTDRSQFEVCWSVQLVGADISTPVPGESSFGIDVSDTSYCFYVRETSVVKDCTHYFSAPDDSTKKSWIKALNQIARDGPRAPRFAVSQAENEFEFHARVVKFRPHVDGTHAEYMIACSCQVFSKLVARRLMKEWSIWRRFSEFDELHLALKNSLGAQMEGIDLVKHKRDAFRGVLGKAFDLHFLEERRVLLDSFVTNVCKITTAVDFFKHHSDPHLKTFFEFDNNCDDVVQSPRKAKESLNKSKRSTSRQSESGDVRRPSAASRISDIEDGRKSSHSRASAASDAGSEGGSSRSKGSRSTTRHSKADKRRDSTSSQMSSSQASTPSRASDSHASAYDEEGSTHRHHRRQHRKKTGDADQKERPSSEKRDRHKSGKREPTVSYGSAEAEVRLADPTF